MSGEVLFSDPVGDGFPTRFVRALRLLVDEVPIDTFSLIGGFAVMARLGRVHRVTEDIDATAEQLDGTPHSRLFVVVHDDDRRARTVGGVKVDCIDVGAVAASDINPDDLPDDEFDRAFCLAHRWALDTATVGEITVVGPDRSVAGVAQCRIARPAALVAMKLQSAPRRPAARAVKASNDYADLFFLLDKADHARALVTDLASAPHGLATWCAERIREDLVQHADRTARLVEKGTTVTPVSAADLQTTATDVLRRLQPLLTEPTRGSEPQAG